MRKIFAEIVNYKELIKYLVVTDLKLTHYNMLLGHLWWIINPFLWVGVYWLLVSVIFRSGESNYVLFLSCAILPWRAFTMSVSRSLTCISTQERIIKQIAFPRIVLPLSVVFSNSIHLFFSIIILICVALLYKIWPTINLIFLPVIIITQLIFTLGISILLSIAGIYLADLQNIIQFILRVWLYLSPSLYSLERVPEHLRKFFLLNPFTSIFISYRHVIMYGNLPIFNIFNWLFLTLLFSFIFLCLALWIFHKQDSKIPKII